MILLCWIIAVVYQKRTRTPTALKIIQQRMEQFESTSFEELTFNIGKGYTYETLRIDGIDYYLGYLVLRSETPDAPALHSDDSLKTLETPIRENEIITEVRITLYVDCVTLLPFTNLRVGPGFEFVIKNKNL